MKPTIGGVMDLATLAALAGTRDDARMRHFTLLNRQQRAEAVQRLAATGMSEHGISHATGLAVEQIRTLIHTTVVPDSTNP